METLVAVQQRINETINGYLSGFAATGDWAALASVMPLGILFGAVHALTPGHSKTLLASYLLGSRLALIRGLTVSSILAATHVLSAVVIALFAAELLTRTLVGAGRAPTLDAISRGLLIVIGIWFLLRALRGNLPHPKREGIAVGVIAGLIPCPLTLFVMVLALSRGVPEAGLAFAAAMMIGVGLTLGLVAAATIVGRVALSAAFNRLGTSAALISRSLDGIAGVLLILFGIREIVA